MSKKSKNTIRSVLYTILLVSGLMIASIFWMSASISLCGISGCSGGGFGVNYDPESVKSALIWSGIVAATAPFILFFASKFRWWWIVVTIITLIITPLAGAMLIGSGLDGYPLHRIK